VCREEGGRGCFAGTTALTTGWGLSGVRVGPWWCLDALVNACTCGSCLTVLVKRLRSLGFEQMRQEMRILLQLLTWSLSPAARSLLPPELPQFEHCEGSRDP
jgi:hypothetical protein